MPEQTLFGDMVFGVPMSDIQEVFDYWKVVMGKNGATVLDETRQKKISASIKRRGVDGCKMAIAGCSLSSFHMGQNDRGKKYNDIGLILRSAAKEEQFIDLVECQDDAEEELQRWLNSP